MEKAQEQEFEQELQHLRQCEWVLDEFRSAVFRDRRLSLRLLVVARHFAQHPEAPINQASETWSKTKAAYRFFDNSKVTPELILRSHYERTAQRIESQTEEILVIQDTTFLNYSHMKCSKDLGLIGYANDHSSLGLLMHTSLAITSRGLPLGIVDQHIWARPVEERGRAKNRSKLPIEEKESYRWIEALGRYSSRIPREANTITVADSEADIYDLFSEAAKSNAKFLVRAKQDRITEEGEKLQQFINELPVASTDWLTIPRQPGRAERKASVDIRFGKVTLPCPKDRPQANKLKSLQLYIISVREANAPDGIEPLSWTLLTNVETKALAHARKRIEWYKARWSIEIFHRILKSGCTVEQARLETNKRRMPYLALYSIIAWNLLLLVRYNRVAPDAPATELLSKLECTVLYSIIHNKLGTNHTFNAKKATNWLAQLGGYLARKKDNSPGPTHLWRGWQRLQDFVKMYIIVAER